MTNDLPSAQAHIILPVERLGDTLLIVPHGDLGGFSAQTFQAEFQRLQRLLADPSLKNLIIDLGDSRYFGSEMMGALIALREQVVGRGRVAVTDCSPDTRAGLEIIKADTLFEFFDTRAQAIRRIASLSVGERIARHRGPLRWVAILALAAALVWGAYATKLTYRLFGSHSARVYEELAREWEQYQVGRTEWAGEESRTYKAQLLDKLASLDRSIERVGWYDAPEHRWLRQAITTLEVDLETGRQPMDAEFLESMKLARSLIMTRTGIPVRPLGPDDEAVPDEAGSPDADPNGAGPNDAT